MRVRHWYENSTFSNEHTLSLTVKIKQWTHSTGLVEIAKTEYLVKVRELATRQSHQIRLCEQPSGQAGASLCATFTLEIHTSRF